MHAPAPPAVSDRPQGVEIGGCMFTGASKGVIGDAATTDGQAAVPDGSIVTEKTGPDHTDGGFLRMLQHGGHPFGRNDLRIIIQEEQVGAIGLADTEIVQSGVVERNIPTQKSQVPPAGSFLETSESFGTLGIRANDQNFKSAMRRQFVDAFNAVAHTSTLSFVGIMRVTGAGIDLRPDIGGGRSFDHPPVIEKARNVLNPAIVLEAKLLPV